MSDILDMADCLSRHREAGVLSMLPGPVIFVAGCYEGDAIEFLRRFHPEAEIFGFDVQTWAADKCKERFASRDKIQIQSFGLGIETRENVPIYEAGSDAATLLMPLFTTPPRVQDFVVGQLKDVSVYCEALRGPGWRPDSCVFNMEGYEWYLLPYMAERRLLPDHLLFQPHQLDGSDPTIEAQKILTYDSLGAEHRRIWHTESWEYWIALNKLGDTPDV